MKPNRDATRGYKNCEAHSPRSSQASESRSHRWRTWRVGLELLVVLAGVAAVVFVYRGDRSRLPNTIADVAVGAEPEVAAMLLEASEVTGRLVDQFPDSWDALDAVAWTHYRFGKSQDAIVHWERCIELDPGRASAYHELGSAAQDAGDLATAVEFFQNAAELAPHSSQHRVCLAESLMNMGELEEAARVLDKDLQVHPTSTPSLFLAGQVYVRLKQYEKAQKLLETVIESAPDYTSAYHWLSTACARQGAREKASEYLDRFKVLKRQDEQRHRDSLVSHDDAADVRKSLAAVHTAAGKVYLAHGDLQTAESHLRRAIEVCPDSAIEPRQVLAWFYQKQGRTDRALAELAELKEGVMEDPAVCLTLGQLYDQLGEFERAEQAYKRLVEISPHRGGGYAALANLYLQANRNLPEARTLAQKAVELEPVALYYFQLALACQRAGDRSSAIAAIEEAMARESGNSDYRQLRERLEKQPMDASLPVVP